MDVAEDLDLAHLHDDSSVLVAAHRHARFEEDVGPWLHLWRALRVPDVGQALVQVRDIVGGLQHDDSLGGAEGGVEDLTDVGGTPSPSAE
jgi:hypothetical protein